MNRTLMSVAASLVGALSAPGEAAPPDLVNFQGVLRDSSDAPLTGSYDMTFRFFDDPLAGNEILVDSHTVAPVAVSGGLFNVHLGGGFVADGTGPGTYTTLADMFGDHGAVWVEVQVGADPPMAPRVRVASAAYALSAASASSSADADTLDGNDSTDFLARNAADDSTASASGPLYTFVNTSTMSDSSALRAEIAPGVVGTGVYYGARGVAAMGDDGGNAGETSNYGLFGTASGSSATGGNNTRNYGVFGRADGSNASAPTYNYGVRGEGVGGTVALGGYFKGTHYGSYNTVHENLNANLYGSYSSATNDALSGGAWFFGSYHQAEAPTPGNNLDFFGVRSWATGAADSVGEHYGVWGEADGGEGNHYGVYGSADGAGGGSHYGVFGDASPFSGGIGTYYGVYGRASKGATNYGGYFDAWNSTTGGGLLVGGYNQANATGTGNFVTVYGLRGLATGSATSTGNHYGLYANATTATAGGTHYGVYGSASGGATNWGLFTPQAASVGEELHVGAASAADNDFLYFDAGAENLWWNNTNSWFVLSDDLAPNSTNLFTLGSAVWYWSAVYANTHFGKNTSIVAFDTYPDLDLLDAMEMVPYRDPDTGRTALIFDPATLPPMIKGDPAVDGEGADQFVDVMKSIGFAFGSLRQLRAESRGRDTALREDLGLRTPDSKTGKQKLDGNLQIVLDRDANDAARLSVFRDGAGGLAEEIFRLDEEGNLYLRGSLRPSSLDLAEYHPVAEPVEPGDVLVADRLTPGRMLRSAFEADPAVVGVASAAPAIELGRSIQRVAALEPDLAAAVDAARVLGDPAAEDLAWAALERRFQETHAAVALSGTVPCKADADHGAIQVGDLLVTSPTPGHAMRAGDPAPGTVLGKALEPLAEGRGLIRVLVMLR